MRRPLYGIARLETERTSMTPVNAVQVRFRLCNRNDDGEYNGS